MKPYPKVYLAAQYRMKEELNDYANWLEDIGVEVTSSWLNEEEDANVQLADLSIGKKIEYAQRDLDDIDRSDAIILFTVEPTVCTFRGGRMHEFGYAAAKGKMLIICGPRENIFHYFPDIFQFDNFNQILDWYMGRD